MIKANELRIGNYIQHTPAAKDLTVESLRSGEINGIAEDQFEPVRLTVDHLEKFRFERGANATGLPSGPYRKGPYEVVVQNEYYEPIYSQPNGTALPHLHQLQNLYFALTGEELVMAGDFSE